MNNDIQQLKNRVSELESMIGQINPGLQRSSEVLFSDLFGLIQNTSAVPTINPINAYDQIQLYSNSTTYRLYVYDTKSKAWRYAALT